MIFFFVLSVIGVSLFSDAYAVSWYDTSWEYRKTITIDNTQVSGTSNLVDFPILVNITNDSDLSTANVQSDGDDFVFTSSDGTTKLSHEIESFSNDATDGTLVAWVKVSLISYDADTEIYMYYGNSNSNSNQDVSNTWNSNYKSVWHLSEDPQINSLEFETVKSINPDFISVTGDIFAVAYSGGTGGGDDGFLKTITINSDGTFGSVLDTLEFDTSKGATPNIIQISGTTYAIAYEGSGADGFVTTVTINADGTIDDAVIDTLEFDTQTGKSPKLIQISGTMYAAVYEGKSADGFLATFTIDSDGTISNSVTDSLEFDTTNGVTPQIIQVSGTTFAVAYEGQNGDGFLKTITINTNGVIGSILDTLEFDDTDGDTPQIAPISGDVYVITYEGENHDGFLKTITIDSAGAITDTVIDTSEFDDTDADTPTLIQISGTTYAISYEDTDTDGQIKSIQISDSGTIGITVTDSTTNSNDGTFGGAMDSADQISGKISNSLDFDGSSDYISVSDSAVTSGTDISVSMWVNISSTSTNHSVLSTMNKDDRKIEDVIFKIKNSGEIMEFFKRTADSSADADKVASTTAITSGTWYYIVGTYNNTLANGEVNLPTESLNLYVNGVLEDDTPANSSFAGANSHTASLGRDGTGDYFQGQLDEIRISHFILTLGWITTEYNNQNDPVSFYTLSAQETQPVTTSTTTSSSSGSDSYSIPVVSGIGLYKLDLNGYESDPNVEQDIGDFGEYFPYAKKSDEMDVENHDNPGYSKRGQYFFTDGDRTEIPTLYGEIGKPIQIQVRIVDALQSTDIVHVEVYTNISGKYSGKSASDTYFIYSLGSPLEIVDPHGFFGDVSADVSLENGWF